MPGRARRPAMAWVYSPPRSPKPTVPAAIKAEPEARANELVESELKSKSIKPPPEDPQFNYIVDIYTKWYRSSFYFCARYACPGPNAISPFFETKFARMEYAGDGEFNLSFMQYTGQWFELYQGLSIDQCLASIRHDPFFMP